MTGQINALHPVLRRTLTMLLSEAWKTSRFNMIEEYIGQHGRVTIHLRLFKQEGFTLKREVRRSTNELGLVACGTVGVFKKTA